MEESMIATSLSQVDSDRARLLPGHPSFWFLVSLTVAVWYARRRWLRQACFARPYGGAAR
jgi:hypothetical protein